jgi:tyrosyl-tRNA synthetase
MSNVPNNYNFDKLKEAVLFNTSEVLPSGEVLDEELKVLVEEANRTGEKIYHYIGFEISGQVHIGSGIATAIKVKKLTDAGVYCRIWLADYHTWLNNKLDGTIETARKVAREYFGPVMIECMKALEVDLSKVEILHAEEVYKGTKNSQTFFDFDLTVAKNLTLSRVMKSISIMGKTAGDNVEFATLRYPPMQVADAFFLNSHFVHAGMDQRKCHVLMREVAPKLSDNFGLKIGEKQVKPIAIHHALLLSLSKPAEDGSQERMRDELYEENKMSKSKPDFAVFVHDSTEDINRKLKKAYCPMVNVETQSEEEIQKEQELNPILDWCKKMIFPAGKTLQIERPEKFGGNVTIESYEDLEKIYLNGDLHPMDLKSAVAKILGGWFSPIRDFVETDQKAKFWLEKIKR